MTIEQAKARMDSQLSQLRSAITILSVDLSAASIELFRHYTYEANQALNEYLYFLNSDKK